MEDNVSIIKKVIEEHKSIRQNLKMAQLALQEKEPK